MCLPWRQGSIPARVREEGKRVRIREPQYTQGCKKIERAAVQVNQIVENFLLVLGVSPEIARRDAEGMEHHVSEVTLDAFRLFTQKHGAK
ncbi:hypothetical protein AWP54_17590 [Escherichia coli]|uniref:iron dependent repressor, metal binding and dimerization domain protein n=1 Tax=Escherichia coli TaxID=562 RepID=UPI000945D52C|nr:hypothetical protein AWP54_17590 [Escherichia coli]